MIVEPYMYFDGRCDEALEFYKSTLGATVTFLIRFKDNPEPGTCSAENAEKVMHCSFEIGPSRLMASDGHCTGNPKFQGITLSLTVDSDSEAERLFMALGSGGQVQMPLTKTFFSSRFGMVADRFGVSWMVIVRR